MIYAYRVVGSGAMEQTEVIVVGAGPVGLCLATLLAERGIEVLVLEAAQDIERDLRASTFHPPTLDMLDEIGVTPRLIEQGLICPAWQIRWHPYGERAIFDLSVLADVTAHPYRLQVEQWKLSILMRQLVDLAGTAEIHFNARVIGVELAEDGAVVAVETADGPRKLRAKYVVGCDGSRSIVRQSLGLTFDGTTYPETTILATTTFPFEEHLEGLSNVTYCWKEQGQFSLLRVPGRWRVSVYPREDVPIEEQLTAEAMQASFQDIVARNIPYDIGEQRPYRVHMRIAPRFRCERALIAGDAAHLNAPSGGMGLNGGIHDAFELAQALGAVLREGAREDRLDLYDRRRHTVAREDVISQADRNRARMRERDPERRREILKGLQAVTADCGRMHDHLVRSSMIEGLRRAAAIN
jgi:2-polyprenyl-6-methoxyphenol hydroxylase-like FAD-dependent oxidoreductase